MSTMGIYCKAYSLEQLRRYPRWPESIETQATLQDQEYLFVQDNYTVTEGIFIDEKIVLKNVTDEWKKFCADELQFSIPKYVQEAAVSR